MGFDLKTLKSHPDKFLLDHIQGVRENVEKLTKLKIADLVAIFHDLAKMNPNFQAKLDDENQGGYTHHSYFSAYAFFCAFCLSLKGQKMLKSFLNKNSFSKNDMIALIVLIAKHHGNLPDFIPQSNYEKNSYILSEKQILSLFNFLENGIDMPIEEYVRYFFDVDDFKIFFTNNKTKKIFLNDLIFEDKKNLRPLEFFLDNQFAFASVIQSDKADAGKIGNIIEQQQNDVLNFSQIFSSQLDAYLSTLKQDTELNKLRTKIRNEAVENIHSGLTESESVFELTAPTGSGKTLMMLSLASEIIKTKGAKRIIYALPFLSITEQVETEVLKIFEGYDEFIQRVDSKSENDRFEKLQEKLDDNPAEGNFSEINALEFQENTFAYPFVITTFVRFFETLLSNRNGELLKLPNFSNSIFLLDEIQSLPPRLYGFFVAYLKKLCQKFNSFAIISTATQPNFKLPKDNSQVKEFFYDYVAPKSILSLKYFDNELFNRYRIQFDENPINMEQLSDMIIGENSSVLIILNTIDDTKELYKKLLEHYDSKELILLNTHFTPRDRKLKIYLAKRRLRENKQVIVISTQLIEAGVDIDFPVLYRDFAIVPSIIQSAGRCNRNGKLNFGGKVSLFMLQKKGKLRSELIYQKDKDILIFTKQVFDSSEYQEKDLLRVQRAFFNRIQSDLNFAKHSQNNPNLEFDFLKDIKECMYDKIGKFQLVDNQLYGKEVQYYIPNKNNDCNFVFLLALQSELVELIRSKATMNAIKLQKKKIEFLLKKMSRQIVQIRLKNHEIAPSYDREYFNIRQMDRSYYSFEKGIDLEGGDLIL